MDQKLRTTHTYATLEVSATTYLEIKRKLEAAGYGDRFHEDQGKVLIDMQGIALEKSERKRKTHDIGSTDH